MKSNSNAILIASNMYKNIPFFITYTKERDNFNSYMHVLSFDLFQGSCLYGRATHPLMNHVK